MATMIRTLHRPARLIAALASALLLTTPAMSAGAAGTTLGHTATPSTVVDGGTVNLTVTSPLYGAGTATRWLQEKIDPTVVHLTSPSQIRAPEGWKVQYSTDGVAFSDVPPSTPDAWGRVQYVRARGSYASGGIIDGKQAVTTTETVPLSSGASNTIASKTGDGWDVFFDADGHVFNLTHLQVQLLDCHNVSGSTCSGSWPLNITNLTGLGHNTQTSGWVDERYHHVWIADYSVALGSGFLCVDISDLTTPSLCGGTIGSAFLRTGDAFAVEGVFNAYPLPMTEYGGLLYLDNSMQAGVSASIGWFWASTMCSWPLAPPVVGGWDGPVRSSKRQPVAASVTCVSWVAGKTTWPSATGSSVAQAVSRMEMRRTMARMAAGRWKDSSRSSVRV